MKSDVPKASSKSTAVPKPKKPIDIIKLSALCNRLLAPALALFIAVCAIFLAIVVSISNSQTVPQGIIIENIAIGGMELELLENGLEELIPDVSGTQELTLLHDELRITSSFSELSVSIDRAFLLNAIRSYAQDGGLLRRFMTRLTLIRSPVELPIPLIFDASKMDSLLEQAYNALHRPATAARLILEPAKVTLQTGSDGLTVDTELLAGRIQEVLITRKSGSVRIPTREIRAILPTPEELVEAVFLEPYPSSQEQNLDGKVTGVPAVPGREISLEDAAFQLRLLDARTNRLSVSRELPVQIIEPQE